MRHHFLIWICLTTLVIMSNQTLFAEEMTLKENLERQAELINELNAIQQKKLQRLERQIKKEERSIGRLEFELAKKAYEKGDRQAGLKHLRSAAQYDFPEALYVMGVKHVNGGQVDKDEALALEYFQKASKLGHAMAAFEMFKRYNKGEGGVAKDEARAHDHLFKSVTQGNTNPSARFLLAQNYLYGFGAKKSPSRALPWLRLAAADGHVNSQKTLELPDLKSLIQNSRFKDCPECPDMVTLPSELYLMGFYNPDEPKANSNSKIRNVPRHMVNLPHTFSLSEKEITYGQWARCVADGACKHKHDVGEEMNNHPVVNISWNDALEYVGWLSGKTGKPYRLPTESEWEFAARSGMNSAYPWGNQYVDNQANCADCGSRWDNQSTAPVGSFAANGYGLYDMLGNVAEMTEDCFNRDYVNKPPMGVPWRTGHCPDRIVRGGAWNTDRDTLRAFERDYAGINEHRMNMGLRVALTLKEHPKRQQAMQNEDRRAADQQAQIEAYNNKPYCHGEDQIQGWGVYWADDYYMVKPTLINLVNGGLYTKVELWGRPKPGVYSLRFSGMRWNQEDYTYMLLVDGQTIYEGEWDVTVTPKGSLMKPPQLTQEHINQLKKGRMAEVRKLSGPSPEGTVVASAQFALENFAEVFNTAQKRQQQTATDKSNGVCKDPSTIGLFGI